MVPRGCHPPSKLQITPPTVEGTFAWRATGARRIQINVPAIHPNALPPNITPSCSPSYLIPATLGATSPLPSQGSPTRGQKIEKSGDNGGGK